MTGVFLVAAVRLYREGLERLLLREPSLKVVGSSASIEEAIAAIPGSGADVALVDPTIAPAMTAVRAIRAAAAQVKIVALALAEDASEIIAWAEAGMTGYVTRHCSLGELVETIHRAMRGQMVCPPEITAKLLERLAVRAADAQQLVQSPDLTPREWQIAALITDGLTNKEIARRLSIALPTVKNHVHSILDKMHVRRRADVALRLRPTRIDTPPMGG
jgi:two-component system, NarL family, nitrate/nitrite response regulator NarL